MAEQIRPDAPVEVLQIFDKHLMDGQTKIRQGQDKTEVTLEGVEALSRELEKEGYGEYAKEQSSYLFTALQIYVC